MAQQTTSSMKQPRFFLIPIVALWLLCCKALTAEEEPSDKSTDSNQTATEETAEKKPAAPAEPKVHKVQRKPFQMKVTLNGMFESSRMNEVSIPVKSWGELVVLDALPQGTQVKKGDSLVTLDYEKIDAKIRAHRHDMAILDLDHQIAKADLKLTEIIDPMELSINRCKPNIGNLAYPF